MLVNGFGLPWKLFRILVHLSNKERPNFVSKDLSCPFFLLTVRIWGFDTPLSLHCIRLTQSSIPSPTTLPGDRVRGTSFTTLSWWIPLYGLVSSRRFLVSVLVSPLLFWYESGTVMFCTSLQADWHRDPSGPHWESRRNRLSYWKEKEVHESS